MPNISPWPNMCIWDKAEFPLPEKLWTLSQMCVHNIPTPYQPNPSHALPKCQVLSSSSFCGCSVSFLLDVGEQIQLSGPHQWQFPWAIWVQIMKIHLHKVGFILVLLGASSALCKAEQICSLQNCPSIKVMSLNCFEIFWWNLVRKTLHMTMPIMSLNVLSSEGSDIKILIPSLLLTVLSALCVETVQWRHHVRLSDTSSWAHAGRGCTKTEMTHPRCSQTLPFGIHIS